MGVALLSVFGLLALGLASIGLYGIMAYSVNQRKREVGCAWHWVRPRLACFD
jgi:ABC-type antimicrobial peptide transport system permease subunit